MPTLYVKADALKHECVKLCYKAVAKKPEFRFVNADVSQREYFPFHDYEYVLDVSKQEKLMPETISLEEGLAKEFAWYKENPDSVYYRKPYSDAIARLYQNGGF